MLDVELQLIDGFLRDSQQSAVQRVKCCILSHSGNIRERRCNGSCSTLLAQIRGSLGT